MAWTERFKAKLSRKRSTTPPPSQASSTSIAPHAPATPGPSTPGPATSQPSLSERLWNQAYDQTKADDFSTVDIYEKILSASLDQKDADPADASHTVDLTSQQNTIEQDSKKRCVQMRQLVQDGLKRTERDAKVKRGVEDGIQVVMTVKEVVDKAVQAAPEAAIAWVGVCFALEVSPTTA